MKTEVSHILLNEHIPNVCDFFYPCNSVYCSQEVWELVRSAVNNSRIDDIHSIFFSVLAAASKHSKEATIQRPSDFQVVINSCHRCPDWQNGDDRIYFMQLLKLPKCFYIRLASDTTYPEALNNGN